MKASTLLGHCVAYIFTKHKHFYLFIYLFACSYESVRCSRQRRRITTKISHKRKEEGRAAMIYCDGNAIPSPMEEVAVIRGAHGTRNRRRKSADVRWCSLRTAVGCHSGTVSYQFHRDPPVVFRAIPVTVQFQRAASQSCFRAVIRAVSVRFQSNIGYGPVVSSSGAIIARFNGNHIGIEEQFQGDCPVQLECNYNAVQERHRCNYNGVA